MTTDRANGPVRFALVGAGSIGRHHASVIAGLTGQARLVAVISSSAEKATQVAADFGGAAYSTLADALASVELDVVVICTPTGAHAEAAITALVAGKHLIIEKPVEVSLARIDAIAAAQQQAGTLVAVISQHRFDPAAEAALVAISAGRLGRLTSGVASIDWWRDQSYYDSATWRGTWHLDGGGALMNQGVHTVALLLAALGTPVEVFAYTAQLAHERIETEDVAAGVVRFANGALGMLHATTAAFPGMSARLQIHGDRGSLVLDDGHVTFSSIPLRHQPHEQKVGGDAHRAQYDNFLAALRGEESIRVGLAENRLAICVILGAYESARTGRPVTLAENDSRAPQGGRDG